MKTLVRKSDGTSLYLFDDSVSIDLLPALVIVGQPADFTIGDLNDDTARLIENVTPPADWVGGKYRLINGQWVDTEQIKPPVPATTKVSPVEFKMLFSSMERVAIRKARATDPTVDDFFDLVEDPRLTYVDLALPSVQGALRYLAATQLITDARIAEILSGKVL